MKIKETVGLVKYLYQYKAIVLLPLIFIMNCLMYIFMPVGVMIQGLMVSISSVYFVNVISQVYASDMVQSSEKVKKNYIKNHTVMLLISNVIHFILFIVPSVIFIFLTYETPNVAVSFVLLNFIVSNIGIYISVSVIYKKRVLGILILALPLLIFGLQMPLYFTNAIKNHGKIGAEGLSFLPEIQMWMIVGLLIVAGLVCIVSPFIYYGISKLMKNVPMSKSYTDRLPWGKV